jgi:hypothetical protein
MNIFSQIAQWLRSHRVPVVPERVWTPKERRDYLDECSRIYESCEERREGTHQHTIRAIEQIVKGHDPNAGPNDDCVSRFEAIQDYINRYRTRSRDY